MISSFLFDRQTAISMGISLISWVVLSSINLTQIMFLTHMFSNQSSLFSIAIVDFQPSLSYIRMEMTVEFNILCFFLVIISLYFNVFKVSKGARFAIELRDLWFQTMGTRKSCTD